MKERLIVLNLRGGRTESPSFRNDMPFLKRRPPIFLAPFSGYFAVRATCIIALSPTRQTLFRGSDKPRIGKLYEF